MKPSDCDSIIERLDKIEAIVGRMGEAVNIVAGNQTTLITQLGKLAEHALEQAQAAKAEIPKVKQIIAATPDSAILPVPKMEGENK